MKVVHCKKEPYDVYIGRPGPWGNPFKIGVDGDRAAVITMYRIWGKAQGLDKKARAELHGKTLGCWCSPEPCHGDVLMEWANEEG